MADGDAQMDDMIARLKSLPRKLEHSAPKVAIALKRRIDANVRAGVSPTGKPWAPTKDGRKALPNADKAVQVQARGTVVLATVDGVYGRHHLGAVKGGIKREILPRAGVPELFAKSIKDVLDEAFIDAMGVGRG